MKTTLLALIAALGLGSSAFAASAYPSYGSLPGSWTAPAVYGTSMTAVTVSTVGFSAGPSEVSGNPVYSSISTPASLANPFYINIMIQNVDQTADIYCSYSSNVSTTTAPGNIDTNATIRGSANMGFRICGSSGNISTPPSCSPVQLFALMPYQQFYCVSANPTKASMAIITKWR